MSDETKKVLSFYCLSVIYILVILRSDLRILIIIDTGESRYLVMIKKLDPVLQRDAERNSKTKCNTPCYKGVF